MNKKTSNEKSLARRVVAMGIVVALVLAVFVLRLVEFQIIEQADDNAPKTDAVRYYSSTEGIDAPPP